MFTVLLDKIVSIMEANELIQEVFNFEKQEFDGDPVASVSPSGNEADYQTTNFNERIYSFSVKLFVGRTSREKTGKDADRVLRDLVDSVVDDIDKDFTFAGLTVPTGYCMINVFAQPTQWGYTGAEDEYRVAEVIVRCRVSVDVFLIS